jgi:hypothetical protein
MPPVAPGGSSAELPLDFDAWARLSARLLKRRPEEREKILEAAKLDPAVWARCDDHWSGVLSGDLAEGELDRARIYSRCCADELEARRVAKEAPERPVASPSPEPPAAVLAPPEPAPPPVAVPSYLHQPSPLPVRPPAAPALSETFGPLPAPLAPLPFGDQPAPAFLEELVSGPKASAPVQSGETLGVGAAAIKASEVLPFEAQSRAPAEQKASPPGAEPPGLGAGQGSAEEPYGLTLEQYASLWAELAMFPERSASVLARYGLPDEDARKKLNDAWGKRFMKQPALRRTWMELCARYREWLQQQRKAGA